MGTAPAACSQEVKHEPNFITLQKQEKVFLNYNQDFLDFAKAHGEEEFEQTMDLIVVSSEMEDRLAAASTILGIYETLLCKDDRALQLPTVKHQLQFYSTQVGFAIKQTNLDLANLKSPATIQLALRMKDDLRSTAEMLDAIAKTIQ